MATGFDYKITLVDSFGEKSTISFYLGIFDTGTDGGDYEAALSASNQLRGALVDITDAFVNRERLEARVADDNQIPAGEILISEEAVIFTHLNAPTELQELYALRVPAPTQAAVFLADGKTVNAEAALVVQYVQQVSQHALVSDGEQINTSTGPYGNGIADPAGYLRTKKRQYK